MSRVRPHDVRKDDSPNSKAEWFCYIKKAENTKKWNEMGNNLAETRATQLPNTIQDHHRRVPCYTSKRMVNQLK